MTPAPLLNFYVINIPLSPDLENGDQYSRLLSRIRQVYPYELKTCQRHCLSFFADPLLTDHLTNPQSELFVFLKMKNASLYQGHQAYSFLLEVICGLKSKLLGENEIVGQFKNAYQEYVKGPRSNQLLRLLEKLFKDAKAIRSQYLLGLGQKTYSFLARKMLFNYSRSKKSQVDHVVILGSGQLSLDLVNQFKKKVSNMTIVARNESVVQNLSREHGLQALSWSQRNNISKFPFIINTIGTDDLIIDQESLLDWKDQHEHRFFIDLGSPSPFIETLSNCNEFMSLNDIFQEGAIHQDYKLQQIQKAKTILLETSLRRCELLEKKLFNTNASFQQTMASI